MRNPQRSVLGLLLALVVLVALSAARSQPNGSFGSSQRSKSVGSDISISSVSILLPQSRSVKYKLEAFNGCFEWCVSSLCVWSRYHYWFFSDVANSCSTISVGFIGVGRC